MIVVLFVKNTKEHPNFSFKVQRADLRYFTAHLINIKVIFIKAIRKLQVLLKYLAEQVAGDGGEGLLVFHPESLLEDRPQNRHISAGLMEIGGFLGQETECQVLDGV